MIILYESQEQDAGRFTPEKLRNTGGLISMRRETESRAERLLLFGTGVIGYRFEDEYEERLFDESISRMLEASEAAMPAEAVASAIREAVDDFAVGTVLPFNLGGPPIPKT